MAPHSVGDGSTTSRMAAQGRGWPHKVEGDGGDVFRSSCITALSWAGVSSASVHSSRVFLSPFEGCVVEEGWERVAQCQEMIPAIPHNPLYSAGDGRTMVGSSNSARITFPGGVRRSSWRGFTFDLGTRSVSEHLMSRSGEQVGCRGLRESSSEAKTRSRG
jgi:hypothetical protein